MVAPLVMERFAHSAQEITDKITLYLALLDGNWWIVDSLQLTPRVV